MNKDWLHKIIYSSGDVCLPEKIKNILGMDLIGTSEKNILYFWLVNCSFD